MQEILAKIRAAGKLVTVIAAALLAVAVDFMGRLLDLFGDLALDGLILVLVVPVLWRDFKKKEADKK